MLHLVAYNDISADLGLRDSRCMLTICVIRSCTQEGGRRNGSAFERCKFQHFSSDLLFMIQILLSYSSYRM